MYREQVLTLVSVQRQRTGNFPGNVMTRVSQSGAEERMTKVTWPVVVVYEDDRAREEAVRFCDEMVRQYWTTHDFEVSWCSFEMLGETAAAMEAAGKAAAADLLIFATAPEGEMPAAVKDWIKVWLSRRGDREGALVGLMGSGAEMSGGREDKHAYLRNVAHSGGMDYLMHIPPTLVWTIPDSLDWCAERASKSSNVLDGILRDQLFPR